MIGTEGFAVRRDQMVSRQLESRGIKDPAVLDAMRRVPREQFVPDLVVGEAYNDSALPIDCQQTISQPYIVALMSEAADLDGSQRVLEIGTGCGYQTAILAELAAEVYSIERHPQLAEQSRERLRNLGYSNVQILDGDGTLGWPEQAPFDRILVTAAAPRIPEPLWNQLAEGGILVIPAGGSKSQDLMAVKKDQGRQIITNLSGCRFVKLIGAAGWEETTS